LGMASRAVRSADKHEMCCKAQGRARWGQPRAEVRKQLVLADMKISPRRTRSIRKRGAFRGERKRVSALFGLNSIAGAASRPKHNRPDVIPEKL